MSMVPQSYTVTDTENHVTGFQVDSILTNPEDIGKELSRCFPEDIIQVEYTDHAQNFYGRLEYKSGEKTSEDYFDADEIKVA